MAADNLSAKDDLFVMVSRAFKEAHGKANRQVRMRVTRKKLRDAKRVPKSKETSTNISL